MTERSARATSQRLPTRAHRPVGHHMHRNVAGGPHEDATDEGETRGRAGASHCRRARSPFSKRPDLDKKMHTHRSNAVVRPSEGSHATLYGRAMPEQNRTCQSGASVTDTGTVPKIQA